LDLVRDFGATVPQWYSGQCPLVDDGKVILGVGSTNALLIAVGISDGKVLWKSPNPRQWLMTHSSVVPMNFGGKRIYVYCGSHGVAGVSADDGSLLWDTVDWKISIATIPSPVILEGGRIFLCGGYNAGSLMLQLKEDAGRIYPKILFRLGPEVFGATQQTPIYYNQHLFGVRPDGQFVCLDLNGKVIWTSGTSRQFGLGPFLLANGVIFAMNDSGRLSLLTASTENYQLLAEAQVLNGRESWGPLALAANRLLARDFTRMVCLEVGTN
jgi:outer membrane protein assembly factor BamB